MKKSEAIFISKNDYYYNLSDFGVNNNLLFITGLVGSGKSSLAKKIAREKNAIVFEFDYIYGLNIPENDEYVKEVLSSFFNNHSFAKEAIKNKYWTTKKNKPVGKLDKLLKDYISYLLCLVKKNKDKLFIIEGIDIYKNVDINDIKNASLIIKRTSVMKCFFRRIKRDKIKNIIKILRESRYYYGREFVLFNSFINNIFKLEKELKKVLFIANSDRHMKLCHIPYLKMFKDNGYIVHVLTNSSNSLSYCDKKINISFKRNPFGIINLLAVFKVRKLVRCESYDLISCHTPIGGFLGRCSVIKNKVKTKVIYTAHGFHFYKKSPVYRWILYYPVEKFLSRFTDLLVTMNEEDYNLANNKFKCPCVKINGIGLDEKRLVCKNENIREKYHLNNKYIITYIAEISNRKNHPKLLKTIKKYDLERENIVFLLVGDSRFKNFDKKIKKYKNVIYVNFVENVADYIKQSDLMIFPSKQEGLPQSVLEVLYFNKMILTFDIRGCNDIIENNVNGILIPNNDMNLLIEEIIKYKNASNKKMISNNIDKYLLKNVIIDVKNKYNKYLKLSLK